jgi:hypothetical protein
MDIPPTDRRTFLARLGVLGALAGTGLILPSTASAAPVAPGAPAALAGVSIDDLVRRILNALNRDTFNAFGAFVVPGSDAYSLAQGTPRGEPGALAARTPEYLISYFDGIVTLPTDLVRGLSSAMAGGLADVPVRLPPGVPILIPGVLEALDDAIRLALRDEQATLPLSNVITVLLNLISTLVNPASVVGPFLSPFARLNHGEKAAVLSVLEGPDLPLITAIESQLPEALHGSISGLVRYLAGSMMELGAFGTYSEWAKFDPRTRTVRGRPVGWTISQFDPGVLNGWNEFDGYYQGRSEVDA